MPINDQLTWHRHLASDNPFNKPTVEEQYPPDLELEPHHLDLDLHIDLANETVSGTVTSTVKARRNGPAILQLDAVDFEAVSARDPDGNALTWRYDDRKLTVHWETPFSAGEERRVEVAYRVVKPAAGLYFSKPSEAYPDQAWYAASDHETERARHWLPCLDLPNVRTTLDFHLRAESHFTILANGYLVEETDNGDGSKTAHWRLEQLCPSYLICVAAGEFVKADDGVFNDGQKEIDLAYFCSPYHSAENLLTTFGRTRNMLAWMVKKFDMPFPYPKYYQFALPALAGAMENISLVSWNDSLVVDEVLAGEMAWQVDQINVHEMAHSYFGDAIVCRDFAHGWLKESWATYIMQVWREDEYSAEEAQYEYYQFARAYFDEADNRYRRPIVTRRFKSSWDMYDRHLYQGGACRLHTLRCELGDEVFWAAVRDYLHRYNGQVVETDDFRQVLEEHSGRSLGQFFDQWFYTAAYPDLKVTFKYDDERKQGIFEIEQTQVDEEKGIPAFVLKTDVSWTLNGQETRWPVTVNRARQTVTVTMAAPPEQVRFDPDFKALHKLSFNPGGPMLRRQLTEAPDVIGRILAAHELAQTGNRNNIQAIVDAYAKESFWGVRRQFLEALANANAEIAVAGLVGIIQAEQDPMVLPDVFRAAGKYRDARIGEAIVNRLQADLPYLSKAAAYEALGKQRSGAPYDLLLEASQADGFNGIGQSGALQGLASSRRAEAIVVLLERVASGATSNRARPAAISALADLGQGQEKAKREQIVETLTDLLRDPWLKAARAAANGLGKLKEPEAISALEAYGRPLSHMERVAVERIIDSVRAADKSDGSALKKQVEELQEKLRKLEDTVQKLEAQSA